MAKKKYEKVDGLGPKDIKNLRSAIRQVWHRSHVRKLVVERSMGFDGFPRCESPKSKCKLGGKPAPKVYIDHKINVGDLDEGYLKRMFTPSKNLQALCKACHNEKTKAERKRDRLRKKNV